MPQSHIELKEGHIHCSHFIYQASFFIQEVLQVGQAWFPFGKTRQTTPEDFQRHVREAVDYSALKVTESCRFSWKNWEDFLCQKHLEDLPAILKPK